jgi:hypothetical protein
MVEAILIIFVLLWALGFVAFSGIPISREPGLRTFKKKEESQ